MRPRPKTFLEWLESQGIELSKEESLPDDPYKKKERWKSVAPPQRAQAHSDALRRFLEYEGKVLAFNVAWDNRDSAFGELVEYKMMYFLQDDTIAIKELHDEKGGKDPFPLLLKKRKVPKKWKERPVSFPSIAMEITDEEVTEYYSPRDLIVGETVFILGRRFLIFDCDKFTRHYYKSMLNIDQPQRIQVFHETKKEFPKSLPPHIGIGTPEDTLQSCFGLMPKPPHKDVIKYNLNANKYLRYLCELDWIHPEDKGRQFVFAYSLADGTIKIGEIPRRNSGIREGKFLKAMLLQTPESDPNFPTYYTPERFFIGAIVPVFKHRFKIIGCDLFVYRYMSANPDKFPQEVIDNVRNYHMSEGNLKDELQEAIRDEQAAEVRAQLAKIGQAAVAEPSAMERCLTALDVVEGSATPPRPPTPPKTTDCITYDDALRVQRMRSSASECSWVCQMLYRKCVDVENYKIGYDETVIIFPNATLRSLVIGQMVVKRVGKWTRKELDRANVWVSLNISNPTYDNVLPLKGILKSGMAREDQQKVVCFSGPAPDEHREKAVRPTYPPGQQPHFTDDEDFCERYKDADAEERAARREHNICPYEVIPNKKSQEATGEEVIPKPQLPGYLGTYGVDCKEVPDYMRLSPDAFEKVKKLRRDVPEISPAAARVAEHPREPPPPVEACLKAPAPISPCAKKKEDVAFACPHVKAVMPCCDPDKRGPV
ncbi:unnamed protein product [Pieris brassicae]|uniref:DM10 domain-containing protein n=1 Tax=Pieris brassicae TaxID=7116 RepID=A0A9P0TLN4_PIEBR|nr:unnamed protein product [Pieris brassicae]